MKSFLASLSIFSLVLVAVGVGCQIDDNGLGELKRPDAGSSLAGSTGAAGTRGAAGTTGAAGSLGSTGSAGTSVAGVAGTTGAAGSVGSTGVAGTTGAAGDGGTAGVSGVAGTTGIAGTTGTAGTTGVAGTSGAAGTTGGAGTTGAAGTGVVVPACNAESCKNGCCDGDTCVTSRNAQRCGAKGAACAPCGGCQVCGAGGECDVDPSSEWTIICDRARIATTPTVGPSWDPPSGGLGGVAPDPVCQFEMPAHTTQTSGKTTVAVDSFSPVWGQTVTPAGKTVKAADLMSSAKTWRIWLFDDDGCSVKDGCVFQPLCEINQPLTAGALLSGEVTHENLGSCLSLTVQFVCASQ